MTGESQPLVNQKDAAPIQRMEQIPNQTLVKVHSKRKERKRPLLKLRHFLVPPAPKGWRPREGGPFMKPPSARCLDGRQNDSKNSTRSFTPVWKKAVGNYLVVRVKWRGELPVYFWHWILTEFHFPGTCPSTPDSNPFPVPPAGSPSLVKVPWMYTPANGVPGQRWIKSFVTSVACL